MANKKKDELEYLQMPLPSGNKRSKLTKLSFQGLNMAQTIDTGVLCDEKNISTTYAPYLTPSPVRKKIASNYTNPVSIHGFDDCLLVVYANQAHDKLLIDYIKLGGISGIKFVRTGVLKEDDTGVYSNLEPRRSIVRFNVYVGDDPINGEYDKEFLIFPDKKSMKVDLKENDDEIKLYDMAIKMQSYTNGVYPYNPPANADKSYYQMNINEGEEGDKWIYVWGTDYKTGREKWIRCEEYENGNYPACPDIEYATVHLSRVFGVGNGRIYASGFNDYSNWNLDSADEYNESNAWVSATQTNAEADSSFVGIKTYQGHVVAFKKNYIHEVYNTKNPFRVYDIFNEGCIDGRTICEVDGKLFFLSEDNVKIYTGSDPKNIGYPLGIEKYDADSNVAAGTDKRKYYLYCRFSSPGISRNKLFVYDTYCEQWAIESVDSPVCGFANNNVGLYMLCEDGCIYHINTDIYDGQEWSFETDLYSGNSIDIKHISKIQVLCELQTGSELKVYMLLNGENFNENMEPVYSTVEERTGTYKRSIRFVPRKSANYGFKLRFEGVGYIKVYSLEMQIVGGGEKYIE